MLLIGLPTEAVTRGQACGIIGEVHPYRRCTQMMNPAKRSRTATWLRLGRRSDYDVWMRDFVALLRERGLNGRHP